MGAYSSAVETSASGGLVEHRGRKKAVSGRQVTSSRSAASRGARGTCGTTARRAAQESVAGDRCRASRRGRAAHARPHGRQGDLGPAKPIAMDANVTNRDAGLGAADDVEYSSTSPSQQRHAHDSSVPCGLARNRAPALLSGLPRGRPLAAPSAARSSRLRANAFHRYRFGRP